MIPHIPWWLFQFGSISFHLEGACKLHFLVEDQIGFGYVYCSFLWPLIALFSWDHRSRRVEVMVGWSKANWWSKRRIPDEMLSFPGWCWWSVKRGMHESWPPWCAINKDISAVWINETIRLREMGAWSGVFKVLLFLKNVWNTLLNIEVHCLCRVPWELRVERRFS